MPIIKKLIILTIFILSPNHLFAQEVEKIGKYKDWETLVAYEASGKVCFAQSSPKVSHQNQTKGRQNFS